MREKQQKEFLKNDTLCVRVRLGVRPACICFSPIYSVARKMKLEFLENPSSILLEYSRISNLFQAHFWDFLEIACWYLPDLARIQATKLRSGRISLNFK